MGAGATIGAAAGTALSPLPWKLMDDSSIWSQNWPWTPVPPDGEKTYTKSTCTLCPGGCGISVRMVDDDRAIKIEGMESNPVNDGGICILGLAGLQLLYGPTRVKTPMKRMDGKLVPVSWDDAIAEIVEKLSDLRANGQAHTVACISGSNRGTLPALLKRFLTAYGSPNFMHTATMADSYSQMLKKMHGNTDYLPGFDVANADYILSFGSGVIDGWGSPVNMFRSNSKRIANGGTLIQIEPRLSNSAAKASRWVPINPGTEGLLALGIAHVIISESRYNSSFISGYTNGFESFRQAVLRKYKPADVAAMTGVDADTIAELAKNFTAASHPLAICGRGQGRTPGAVGEFAAIHTLNALVGNINKKGGFWAMPADNYINWPEVEPDDIAAANLEKPRLDGAGSDQYPQAVSLLNHFAEAVASETPYPVQALFVSGANPIYTTPDSNAFAAALNKIPFVVSFSSYMDETARQADLILPNPVFLERYEDVPTPIGFLQPYIGLSRPVVESLLNTRNTGDVVIQIAQAIGNSIAEAFPWEDYYTCLEETLADNWDTLTEEGYWTASDYAPSAWYTAFETDSGNFEFIDEATNPLIEVEGDASGLALIPYDSLRLASGYIGSPPFLTKTVSDTLLKGNESFVEINPKTAASLGLSEGSNAVITTPKGKAAVRIHLFEGVVPGVVAMPRGLGHTAYDDYLAGKGINVNQLLGPVTDPASGLDAAWGIRAKLAKA